MKNWKEHELVFLKENYNVIAKKDLAVQLDKSENAIRLKLQKLNLSLNDIKWEQKECKNCEKLFTALKSENKLFCSQSCSASYNNKGIKRHGKSPSSCVECNTVLKRQGKFCNNICEQKYKTKDKDKLVLEGKASSRVCKNYLIKVKGNKCEECGWSKKNIVTGKIPIELEHIDGNSENNNLTNLKLLCPNCHSLTPTYKALNIGKGRHSRKIRYQEGKSF